LDIAFYFLIHLADVRCDLDPTPEARAQQTHCLKCVIGHYVPLPEGCEDLVAAAIGEPTRDALRHKRGSGERVGNIWFGFRLSPDSKHVEPDPGEQGVLTEIGHLHQSEHTVGSPRYVGRIQTEVAHSLPITC
jgi:hypothetical protein